MSIKVEQISLVAVSADSVAKSEKIPRHRTPLSSHPSSDKVIVKVMVKLAPSIYCMSPTERMSERTVHINIEFLFAKCYATVMYRQ